MSAVGDSAFFSLFCVACNLDGGNRIEPPFSLFLCALKSKLSNAEGKVSKTGREGEGVQEGDHGVAAGVVSCLMEALERMVQGRPPLARLLHVQVPCRPDFVPSLIPSCCTA